MLQTNRQTHKTRRDAAGNQLLITELAMSCRCRMQDAAVNVCDMNLQRNHLQAVDKLGGACTAAFNRERNDTGGALRQIFLCQRMILVRRQIRIVDKFYIRLLLQELRNFQRVAAVLTDAKRQRL